MRQNRFCRGATTPVGPCGFTTHKCTCSDKIGILRRSLASGFASNADGSCDEAGNFRITRQSCLRLCLQAKMGEL